MNSIQKGKSKKLRIAFLYHANNVHLLNRAKYFLSQGHTVYYFGFLPEENAVKTDELKNLIRIHIPRRFIFGKINLLNLLSYVFYIRKLTKKYKLDVLHIQNAGFGIFTPFSKAKVTILENMGSDVILLADKSILRRLLYRKAYKHVDAVIQDSFIAKRKGKQWGAPGKNNYVINIGIDLNIFNMSLEQNVARARLQITPDQKFIFSPRGMSALYNHDVVIQTLPKVSQKYPDCVYVFTGNYDASNFSEETKNIINNPKYKKNIYFTGMLDNQTELPFYYRDCDVLISVPSSDSSPLTVYEAMACGAPVIVSELPWYKGLFIKDQHIRTVPVKDVGALSEQIELLMEKPGLLDQKLSFKRVAKRLDYSTENKRLFCLYSKLVSGKKISEIQ